MPLPASHAVPLPAAHAVPLPASQAVPLPQPLNLAPGRMYSYEEDDMYGESTPHALQNFVLPPPPKSALPSISSAVPTVQATPPMVDPNDYYTADDMYGI